MDLDPRLPHAPYVAAVVAELGGLVGPDAHAQYCDMGPDDVMWLEAFIDLAVDADHLSRPAIVWRQTDGWRVGDYDGRGTLESIGPLWPGGAVPLVPAPVTVAAAARRLVGPPGATVVPVDTDPADGPLPDAVAAAVECGDLTGHVGVRLAAYYPAVVPR